MHEPEDNSPAPPRAVRLQEFFARLREHKPFSSFDEAFEGLVSALEAVENELTALPNRPWNWRNDGRLYPPQRDNWHRVPSYPSVTRMRTKGHNIFIAANGALEIQAVEANVVVFSKAGADGRKVWDP